MIQEVRCDDCGESFKNINIHNSKTNTICKIHKNILFTCRLCCYNTKNYKEILYHVKLCNGDLKLKSPIELLELKLSIYEDKIKASEKIIEKYIKTISDLERTLQIEKIYNNVLNIFFTQNNDNINFKNLREDLNDGIHFYNIKEEDIPFIFHTVSDDKKFLTKHKIQKDSFENNDKQLRDSSILEIGITSPILSSKKEIPSIMNFNLDTNKITSKSPKNKITEKIILKPKKDRYRPIDCVELNNEDDITNELTTKLNKVEDSIKETINLNFENINLDECYVTINNIFNTIKEGKLYSKDLNVISKIRCKMLGWLNIKQYEILIREHFDILNNLFNEKKYDKNKRNKLIFDSFSSLELRLIRFGKYYEKSLDIDDIERLRISMEFCTFHPKQYESFKRGFKKFQNYNIVLFTLKKCIESNLINRYGFNNIVYINLPNSKDNDPYSYYYLEKLEDIHKSNSKSDPKRYWKLDCRLEDLSEELCNTLLPYCITLYRSIYYDMFNDNIYRKDIDSIYPIAGNELDQLIENILLLSNLEKVRDLLRDIIKEKCLHKPTDMDLINLRADDTSQKSRFKEYRKNYNQNEIISKLYTIITENEINEFLNKFT